MLFVAAHVITCCVFLFSMHLVESWNHAMKINTLRAAKVNLGVSSGCLMICSSSLIAGKEISLHKTGTWVWKSVHYALIMQSVTKSKLILWSAGKVFTELGNPIFNCYRIPPHHRKWQSICGVQASDLWRFSFLDFCKRPLELADLNSKEFHPPFWACLFGSKAPARRHVWTNHRHSNLCVSRLPFTEQ